MGVGSAEAEAADAGAARQRSAGRIDRSGPRLAAPHQTERTAGKVDMRIDLVAVERRRQFAPLHRHKHLDDTGKPRSRFQMADGRFDRAEPDMRLRNALAPGKGGEGPLEAVDLDRIAEMGAGSVRLDIADGRGIDARHRLLDKRRLRLRIGRGQGTGAAAMVLCAADDRAENAVAVTLGIAQPLEHQHRDALAAGIAVRSGAEALAASVRRKHARIVRSFEAFRGEAEIDAADERGLAAPVLQRLRGAQQGDQRAGTGRVDGLARAGEVEGMRHPVGDHRQRVSGGDMPVRRDPMGGKKRRIVEAGHANEDAGRLRQIGRLHTGVFDRMPGSFQQQPLLRVHPLGLGRRDAERGRVEAIDIGEEPAAPGEGCGRNAGTIGLAIPLERQVPRQVAPGQQVVEETLDVRAAGEAAGHADNRDTVISARVRRSGDWLREGRNRGCDQGRGAVRSCCGHALGRRCDVVASHQMLGQRLDMLAFEEDRRRELDPEGGPDFARIARQRDGIEAEIVEGLACPDIVRIEFQDPGGDPAQLLCCPAGRLAGVLCDGPCRFWGRTGSRGDEACDRNHSNTCTAREDAPAPVQERQVERTGAARLAEHGGDVAAQKLRARDTHQRQRFAARHQQLQRLPACPECGRRKRQVLAEPILLWALFAQIAEKTAADKTEGARDPLQIGTEAEAIAGKVAIDPRVVQNLGAGSLQCVEVNLPVRRSARRHPRLQPGCFGRLSIAGDDAGKEPVARRFQRQG